MKFGFINNQVMNSLFEDPHISSHVIPVFLECYEKRYIPTCLSSRYSYSLNMSKVVKVFTPEVLEEIRNNDNALRIIKELLSTPGLEGFHALLCKLQDVYPAKPDKWVDIAKLTCKYFDW